MEGEKYLRHLRQVRVFFFLTGRAKKFPTETKESRAEHSFTYFFNSQTPFSVGALNNQKKKKKITERRIAQS